jgi:hypothetical protein
MSLWSCGLSNECADLGQPKVNGRPSPRSKRACSASGRHHDAPSVEAEQRSAKRQHHVERLLCSPCAGVAIQSAKIDPEGKYVYQQVDARGELVPAPRSSLACSQNDLGPCTSPFTVAS